MHAQDQNEEVPRPRRIAPVEGVPISEEHGEDLARFESLKTPQEAVTKAERVARVVEADIGREQARVEEYVAASGEESPEEAIRGPFGKLVYRTRELFERLRDKLTPTRLPEDESVKLARERATETLAETAAERAFFGSKPGSIEAGHEIKESGVPSEQEPGQSFEQEFLSVSQELAHDATDRERSIGELIEARDVEGLRDLLKNTMVRFEAALRAQASESRTTGERVAFWQRKFGKTPETADPASVDLLKRDLRRIGDAIVAIEHPDLIAKTAEAVPSAIDEEPTKKMSTRFPQKIELEGPEESAPLELEEREVAQAVVIDPEAVAQAALARSPKEATLAERQTAALAPIEVAAELKLTPLLDALRNKTLTAIEDRLRELDRLAASSEERTKAGLTTRAVEAEAMLLLDQKRELVGGIIPLEAVRVRIATIEDGLRAIDREVKSVSPEKRRVLEDEGASLDRERTELFRYLNKPYELTIAEEAVLPQVIEKVKTQATPETAAPQPVSEKKTPDELLRKAWNPLALEMEAIPIEEDDILYERQEEFFSALRDALEDTGAGRPKLDVPVVSLDRTRAERAYQNDMETHIALAAEYFFLREQPDLSQTELARGKAIETKIGGRKGGDMREILWFKHRARITSADRLYIENEILRRYREMKRDAQSGRTRADNAAE